MRMLLIPIIYNIKSDFDLNIIKFNQNLKNTISSRNRKYFLLLEFPKIQQQILRICVILTYGHYIPTVNDF